METTWQFLIKRPLVYYCVPILGMVNHKLLDIAFWLVVEPYPSEKWWSESQLGWWHSQYDGKIIKFHGSSHIYTVNNNIINHYYNHITIISSLFSSYLTRFIMTLGGIDHDSIMKSSCFPKNRAPGDLTLKNAELPSRISTVAGGMPGFVGIMSPENLEESMLKTCWNMGLGFYYI